MKILLHSCCAPCSAWIIEQLLSEKFKITVFFYNPNIHPVEEYLRRKAEAIRFAQKMAVPFVDHIYDSSLWYCRVRGLELEPERGKRCSECFLLRLDETAKYALANDFDAFATSLAISRWKDFNQVTAAGLQASATNKIQYWQHNWRKSNGAMLANKVALREGFYRQKYCGCSFSNKTNSKQ